MKKTYFLSGEKRGFVGAEATAEMPRGDFEKLGSVDAATIDGERTTWVKGAAGGRVGRIGDLSRWSGHGVTRLGVGFRNRG